MYEGGPSSNLQKPSLAMFAAISALLRFSRCPPFKTCFADSPRGMCIVQKQCKTGKKNKCIKSEKNRREKHKGNHRKRDRERERDKDEKGMMKKIEEEKKEKQNRV